MRGVLPWMAVLLVVGADRITKAMIVARIEPGSWTEIMLLLLVIFTSVVIIAAMVVRHGHHSRLAGLAFGLILGGAVGNLIDRVLYGAVVDFVHLWVKIGGRTWSWPDFNVADASISVGALLLIANEFRTQPSGPQDAPDSD